MGEGQDGFCCGLVYGLMVAGIIASILGQMREARVQMGHRDRTLDKFPDSAQPGMTSSGIVNTSRHAMFRFFMWSIVLIVIFLVAAGGIFYIMT